MNIQQSLKQIIQEKEGKPSDEIDICEQQDSNQIEIFEPSKFFAKEQIRNLPACLEFRFADSSSKAYPYSHVLQLNYNPSEGIEVLTTQKKIIIEGRNLKLLYVFLLSFQVKFIQENIGHDLTEENKLFVKRIRVEEF